jgi:hypothetical protein
MRFSLCDREFRSPVRAERLQRVSKRRRTPIYCTAYQRSRPSFLSIDQDRTVCKTLEYLHHQYGGEFQLAFANGGDQTNNSIPEVPICQSLGIELIDGVGDKIQSSSWLLKK